MHPPKPLSSIPAWALLHLAALCSQGVQEKSLVPCPWDLTGHSEVPKCEGLMVAENTGGWHSSHCSPPAHGVCPCNTCPCLRPRKARQDSSSSRKTPKGCTPGHRRLDCTHLQRKLVCYEGKNKLAWTQGFCQVHTFRSGRPLLVEVIMGQMQARQPSIPSSPAVREGLSRRGASLQKE